MAGRQVFFNTDARGIVLFSVALHSLLKHNRPDRALRVFVAHDASFGAAGGRERTEAIAREFPFATLCFLDCTETLRRHGERFQSMLWAFPLCDEILPSDVGGKIVYLDIDMQVRCDLGELFDLDLRGAGMWAAAVNESRREHRRYLVEAGWPEAAGYSFNNATTVLDLDAFRRERLSGRMVAWYEEHWREAVNLDQDAQNVVYGAKTLRLPPKWNYTDGWLERLLKLNPFAAEWRVFPPRQVLEAILSPCIVHFIGRKKPTHWTHRPERRAYRREMEEMGLLDHGVLPGENVGMRVLGSLFDGWHGLLKAYARLLLACRKYV